MVAPATLLVDDDLMQCPTAQYTSIQAAVTAAGPGDHIDVCPGTYTEQVVIPTGKDNIRLRSTQQWAAVIKAPPVMMLDPLFVPAYTIVRVAGAQNVTILAFTITGPGPGTCNSLNYGVRVADGGSADILGNHIKDIRDAPPPPNVSGCQNGVAVLVGRWIDGTTGSARIIGNVIDSYQKNGPTVDNAGSHAEIAHNRILGVGPSATIAQNGIQVSRGATADIRQNFVSGNIYAPQTFAASGILFFGPGAVFTDHNTVTGNDLGVYMDNNATPPFGPGCGTPQGSMIAHNRIRSSTFDGAGLAGLAPCQVTTVQVAYNKTDQNGGPGASAYDGAHDNAFDNNSVEENEDGGILLDDADNNSVGNNQVRNNGTSAGDVTDGIRVNQLSMGNTVHDNHLRDNVTHDCHDNSMGMGTAGTANNWLGNHGETENKTGLCTRDPDDASFETTTVYGWDPAYPWSDAFGDAVAYDWATAYATIDTDALLQLLPQIRAGGIRRASASPSP